MKIAVIGAGLMGRAALHDVSQNSSVEQAGIFDVDEKLATEIANRFGSDRTVAGVLDATDEDAVARLLEDYDAVLACTTYQHNPGLTRAAIKAKCHMVDLGGNNDVVESQLALNDEAERAGVIVIPDCGLAPGMVSLMAADGISKLDKTTGVKLRVGGLPQSPRPPLNYQIVFSVEGLINEYWEPCTILKGGKKTTVAPMTGLEELNFDGVGQLEAFYTSGGSSTLPDTYGGQVDFLDYKTIRYPGHCKPMRTMLELGLASRKPVTLNETEVEPRALFKAVLTRNLTHVGPDMVLVRVTVEGTKAGVEKSIVYEIVDRQEPGTELTAMMRTTAFPAAIIAQMAASGQVTERGVKPQELAVKPSLFLPQLGKRGINLTITEE
jgi:lysine 6-dehydrogenase